MKNLRSHSTLRTWKAIKGILWLGPFFVLQCLFLQQALGRFYIDIDGPSIPKTKIAILDFKNLSANMKFPELSATLPAVVSNDLDLTGYFLPMDKEAFLEEEDDSLSPEGIRFKDWLVIGADLLLKGGYTVIGRSLEVEVRLFDVFWGRQILGRRVLGKTEEYRTLMHRVGNEIIYALTGHKGMFLSRLAFVGTSTGHKEIYISDYDGHNVKQVTSDKSIALFPRWSPSGEDIVFNSYKEGRRMLYMANHTTRSVKRILGRECYGASWAPNGEKVALALGHNGNSDLYIMDLTGKTMDRLTTHWASDLSPTFSPDGSRIAFVSDRSGSPQIYVRDLKKGREERLTFFDGDHEGNYNTSPSWSSLGRIAFSGIHDGRHHIYTMDPDGRNLRRLTENQGNNEEPCWSPDGRYIVFSSNREGRYHLYLMNANGQNQKRISFSKGEQTSPSWSPF